MLIIQSNSHLPSFNLAAEEYLFSQWQDEILFLYVNDPSVIIGCNQVISNEINLEFCFENNIQVMRRMSGGGAVFHDNGNLNFCFISNKSDVKSSLNTNFLHPIVEVLSNLGAPITIGKRKDLWLQNEFKITGTASHISKNRELHHGTLLYDSDLTTLEKALNSKTKDEQLKGIASVRSVVKNLKNYFDEQGQITLKANDFFEVLLQNIAVYFQQNKIECLSENEIREIELIAKKKYVSKDWTHKK